MSENTTAGRKFPAEILAPAEIAALLDAAGPSPTGLRNRALLSLLAHSGLRISEALALRESDLGDFAKHSIRLLATKSGQAQTRGWHPGADADLLRWIAARKGLDLSAQQLAKRPLFCTLKGTKLSDRYVRVMLARLAARAGIAKRVTPHTLRHSFACALQDQGVSVTKIRDLLGHSSVAVTSRYLDHLSNHEAVETLAALPSWLPGES